MVVEASAGGGAERGTGASAGYSSTAGCLNSWREVVDAQWPGRAAQCWHVRARRWWGSDKGTVASLWESGGNCAVASENVPQADAGTGLDC